MKLNKKEKINKINIALQNIGYMLNEFTKWTDLTTLYKIIMLIHNDVYLSFKQKNNLLISFVKEYNVKNKVFLELKF